MIKNVNNSMIQNPNRHQRVNRDHSLYPIFFRYCCNALYAEHFNQIKRYYNIKTTVLLNYYMIITSII